MLDAPSEFDPYVKWLGIRSPERPPNHYRLLGLEPLEHDADVIAAAADRQMAHVRRFQNGPHSEISQQLLNQLAAAKVCLLRAESKTEYDDRLRLELLQPSATAQARLGATAGPRARRTRSTGALTWITTALVSVAVLAGAWWATRRPRIPPNLGSVNSPNNPWEGPSPGPATADRIQPEAEADKVARSPVESESKPAHTTVEASNPSAPITPEEEPPPEQAEAHVAPPANEPPTVTPANVQATPPPGPGTRGESALDGFNPLVKDKNPRYRRSGERPAPRSRKNQDEGDDPPPPPEEPESPQASTADPDSVVLLVAADGNTLPGATDKFDQFRQALAHRNTDAAKGLLAELKTESTSFEQRDTVDRLRMLTYQIEMFWQAVERGKAQLSVGGTLVVRGQPAKIVKVEPDVLTLETAKGTTSMALDRANIELDFAQALAVADLARRGAAWERLLAAVAAVEPGNAPQEALQIEADVKRRGWYSPLN